MFIIAFAESHDETIKLCEYIQAKFQELDRQQRQLENERHEFEVKVHKQKEGNDDVTVMSCNKTVTCLELVLINYQDS